MSPGPPPPDPPGEHGPGKPRRARDELGLRRGRPPSLESLQSAFDEMLETFRETLRQTSESGNATRSLQADLNDWRTESEQRREAAARRRKDEVELRQARLRLWRRVGAIAGVVAVILVSAWETWDLLRPAPIDAADVQATVEERTTELEGAVQTNNDRITDVEASLEDLRMRAERAEARDLQLLEAVDAISQKLELSPRARRKQDRP